MAEFRIRANSEGVEVAVHVQPRSKKSEIAGIHGESLKLRVTAPPVDDAANQAVTEYFARLLGIPKSRVQILSGLKSRAKTILIRGVSLAQVQSAIGVRPR
jgi:uncharacterized protein (TIGR00251 family)